MDARRVRPTQNYVGSVGGESGEVARREGHGSLCRACLYLAVNDIDVVQAATI